MIDSTLLGNAAKSVATTSRNLINHEFDVQAHALGERVLRTAHDLEAIAQQLRNSDTISSAANVADWAANYVTTIGSYLANGSSDQFIVDAEAFGRQRPMAIAASAAVLGFVAARVVKSSSARRFHEGDYVERINDGTTGTGMSYTSGSAVS